MAIFNLTYSSINIVIDVLRAALANDPVFQKDGTGKSRSSETLVYDSWGYQVRDFPIVVVTGQSGANRRMDFQDRVRPFYGLRITEAPGSGSSATVRQFGLPDIANINQIVELEYEGDPVTNPQTVKLPVKFGDLGGGDQYYVEFTGTSVGPASTFPIEKFAARSIDIPTGEIFGGWFDMTLDLVCAARSVQERELVADRVWSLLWFLKKKQLRQRGVVVLDVRHSGLTQEVYGADQLYFARLSASIATEFEAVAPYTETVQDVEPTVTAI